MTDDDVNLDEDLSALLDGELSPQRESELRARMVGEPALAARLAELERVDLALRAMPAEAPSPELRASLRAKLEAAATAPADNPRSVTHPRRLLPSWAGGTLAAAAALALYLAVSSGNDSILDAEPARIADVLASATDEEIGIALEFETLADLEVIEDLELLELMVELEEEEAEQG
jgi:anti-sigma factor RsiW